MTPRRRVRYVFLYVEIFDIWDTVSFVMMGSRSAFILTVDLGAAL